LVGWTSAMVRYGAVVAQAPHSVIAAIVTGSNTFNRNADAADAIGPLLAQTIV
jgi:hypothetical protein